ncbi:MAG: hypothetical protein J6W82_08680 [Bacteroidales bacterium]|nr:hypothetical protein [Bacteroidales bacterium]
MKRILSILFALVIVISACAQPSRLRQRLEIAEVTSEDINSVFLQVFKMPDVGRYYLSVGTLGAGDDFIQIQVDPLSELFLPLGETLAESLENLQRIQSLYKQDPGTIDYMDGCLGLSYPGEELEPITLTARKFALSRLVEFSVVRGNWIRATHVSKSDFNSLVGSFKIYCKLHPKEK